MTKSRNKSLRWQNLHTFSSQNLTPQYFAAAMPPQWFIPRFSYSLRFNKLWSCIKIKYQHSFPLLCIFAFDLINIWTVKTSAQKTQDFISWATVTIFIYYAAMWAYLFQKDSCTPTLLYNIITSYLSIKYRSKLRVFSCKGWEADWDHDSEILDYFQASFFF